MNAAVIRPLCLSLLAAAFVLPAQSGTNAAAVAAAREKAREERAAQRQAPEERENRRGDGEGRRGEGGGEGRRQRDERGAPPPAFQAPPPPVQGPPPAQARFDDRRGDGRGRDERGDARGRQDDRWRGGDRGYRDVAPPRFSYRPAPPPPRVVYRLPPGYRSYDWDGARWYHHRGSWYRPYGASYMMVGAPYGMFVPFLPPFSTTIWVRGTRYYVVDDIYYVDEPVRRGYVVARSPYGDDAGAATEWPDDAPDPVLYVYPMRGQSAAQQADDRYACHRWAVEQTRYDPTEGRYAPTERAEYDRAQGACLEARGYSVK